MNVYLASCFELKEQVISVARNLKEMGHHITREWWHYDFKQIQVPDKKWYKEPNVKSVAEANFKAVANSDILILIADPKKPKKFNGANIELGYALALGKQCYSLGKLERSAMYVPVKRCQSLSEIFEGEA